MKRFLLVVMCLLAMSSFIVGLSEGIDLNSLSEYDLIQLQLQIQQRIYEFNPIGEFVLYPGTYFVGRDLEPGSYVFKMLEYIEGNFVGEAYIDFFWNEDEYNNHSIVYEAESTFKPDGEDVAQYNLNDGEIIQLNNGIFQVIKR